MAGGYAAALGVALAAGCASGPAVQVEDAGTDDVVEPFVLTDAPEDLGPGIDVITMVDDAPRASMDGGHATMDVAVALDRPGPLVDVPTVADAGPACGVAAACGACTALAGCGWCLDTGSCEPGAAGGPASGTCATWSGPGGSCSDPCASRTDCGTCTAAAGCGWCAGGAGCMTGSMNGPSSGGCTGTWQWSTNQCSALPGDGCRSSTTCVTCNVGSSCGWCSRKKFPPRGGQAASFFLTSTS